MSKALTVGENLHRNCRDLNHMPGVWVGVKFFTVKISKWQSRAIARTARVRQILRNL